MYACAFGADFFFLFDAEAVFFVNNDKPQIFKHNVFTHQAVRADNHVAYAVFEFLHDGFLFFGCLKAAQHPHIDGKPCQAFGKSFVMLGG